MTNDQRCCLCELIEKISLQIWTLKYRNTGQKTYRTNDCVKSSLRCKGGIWITLCWIWVRVRIPITGAETHFSRSVNAATLHCVLSICGLLKDILEILVGSLLQNLMSMVLLKKSWSKGAWSTTADVCFVEKQSKNNCSNKSLSWVGCFKFIPSLSYF